MKPEGHAITTAAVSAWGYAVTGSPELAVGLGLGGFWIDLDHYLDYVIVERQGFNPRRFLDYYLGYRTRRLVLLGHSYELLAVLGIVAFYSGSPLIVGSLLGAIMHLALDILCNPLRDPIAFYSFFYRLHHGFDAGFLIQHPSLVGRLHAWLDQHSGHQSVGKVAKRA